MSHQERNIEPRIGFDSGEARRQLKEYSRWKADPSTFEEKPTITPQEFERLGDTLSATFRTEVSNSGLAGGEISEEDLQLTHRINREMLGVVQEIVPDTARQSWNASTFQHVTQVEATAWELAHRLDLDEKEVRARAAMHDTGRAGTNHPVLHLLAGRELLDKMGFSLPFKRTAIAHGEAGVGAYMFGVTGETWPAINDNPDVLRSAIAALPIEEVTIAVADMCKRSYIKDGQFQNEIDDSFTGLASAAKRRLTSPNGEPDDSVLTALGSKDPGERQKAMQTLQALGAPETNVNQMAMYYGWMSGLRERIEHEYGVKFDGEDGVIESAKRRYEEMMKSY